MKKVPRAAEVEALLREIQRYLAYVDAFRASDRRRRPAGSGERKGDPGP